MNKKNARITSVALASALAVNAVPLHALTPTVLAAPASDAATPFTTEFNKDDIRSIQVTDFKKDYWPNQYFVSGEYANIARPVKVILTDGNGIQKEVSAHYWSTVTDPETNQKITAWKYYGLEVYIPDDMKPYLTYEDALQNGEMITKIVLPPYQLSEMKIGVRLKSNPEIKGESQPELYTNLYGLTKEGFSINLYRSDDPEKHPVSEIIPGTSLNIDVEVNAVKSVSFGSTMGMMIPGVPEKVILHKVEENGRVFYRNLVSAANPTSYVPFTATVPTLDSKLVALPNELHGVKTYHNTQAVEVLPPIIDRGSDESAAIKGNTGDYVRVVFDAGAGSITENGTSTPTVTKRVFDVLSTVTWNELLASVGGLGVTAPEATPIALGWGVDTQAGTSSVQSLATQTTTVTDGTGKSIQSATFAHRYSPEITTTQPEQADLQNWHTVTFVAPAAHGSIEGAQTTTYWVHKQANPKTVADFAAPTVTPEEGYLMTGWDKGATTPITADTQIQAQVKSIQVTADPSDADYLKVTFDAGSNGAFAAHATTKVWVLKAAQKTLADVAKPVVKASDGYAFDAFDTPDTTSLTQDLTVTATYRELDSHKYPAVVAAPTLNKGTALTPESFVTNKHTDTADQKLPADVTFAFVDAAGDPATPSTATSGTHNVYVKVTYKDGSFKVYPTTVTVRTDAEQYVFENGGASFAGKGTVSVRKNATVDPARVQVTPALPTTARVASVSTVDTTAVTTTPIEATGRVVFADNSELNDFPIEVTVLELDPSATPVLAGLHDGVIWKRDASFTVSLPQVNGVTPAGTLSVTVGGTTYTVDDLVDNGDDTYTVSMPQNLPDGPVEVRVSFTEPGKNPTVVTMKVEDTTPALPVVAPLKEEEPFLKVSVPSGNTDLLMVELPNGDILEVRKEQGVWPYQADPTAADAGKLLIPLPAASSKEGDTIRVIASEQGVQSDPAEITVDPRPLDPQPTAPEVDDIHEGDTTVKVKVPTDGVQVIVALPGGKQVEVLKQADGTWKTKDGVVVAIEDGKLVIPVGMKLEGNQQIHVVVLNRDDIASTINTKITIAAPKKAIPHAGDVNTPGFIVGMLTLLSGASAALGITVRRKNERD